MQEADAVPTVQKARTGAQDGSFRHTCVPSVPKCAILRTAMQKEVQIQEVADEIARGNRVLLLVRHAERPHIDHDDPSFGADLPLTDAGREMSFRFGEILRPLSGDVQFLASPLRRTRETAAFIAKGMGLPDAPIPTAEELGNSSFYFSNQHDVFELFRDGSFFEKVFAYLETGSQTGFRNLHEASDMLEAWCMERFTARLGIFTTHDLYDGAFLCARGVEKHFTMANWTRFLDSAAIIIEPDGARRYAFVRAGLSDRCTGV